MFTEDLQFLGSNKDTSESCVFDWPDRPEESLPPEYPPGNPPPEYPHLPDEDWPNIPVEERPVVPDPDPNGGGGGGGAFGTGANFLWAYDVNANTMFLFDLLNGQLIEETFGDLVVPDGLVNLPGNFTLTGLGGVVISLSTNPPFPSLPVILRNYMAIGMTNVSQMFLSVF